MICWYTHFRTPPICVYEIGYTVYPILAGMMLVTSSHCWLLRCLVGFNTLQDCLSNLLASLLDVLMRLQLPMFLFFSCRLESIGMKLGPLRLFFMMGMDLKSDQIFDEHPCMKHIFTPFYTTSVAPNTNYSWCEFIRGFHGCSPGEGSEKDGRLCESGEAAKDAGFGDPAKFLGLHPKLDCIFLNIHVHVYIYMYMYV